MLESKDTEEIQKLLQQGLPDSVRRRFYAELQLRRALVDNAAARFELKLLQKNLEDLKRDMR